MKKKLPILNERVCPLCASALTLLLLFFTLLSAQAQDRYWVGKTGNWNTTASWSATSGGASGASVPTNSNDVIFDNNSFDAMGQIVTLNTTGNCKSMRWNATGWKPEFNTSSQSLNVSGSLTLQPDMSVTSTSGTLTFNGTNAAGDTIRTNNVAIPKAITFNSATGKWVLRDSLKMTGYQLNFSNGILEAPVTINCNYFGSTNGKLYLDNAILNVTQFNGGNNQELSMVNAIINATQWNYTYNYLPLTATQTAGSLIRVGNTFQGKATDYYNVVEAGTGPVAGGNFKKIIPYPNNLSSNLQNVATDTLIFDMGKTYYFYDGTTITVNKLLRNLRDTEDCAEATILRTVSNYSSTALATLNIGAGAMDLKNVHFLNVRLAGPDAPYTNGKLYSLGGSRGFNSGRLYWVGGDGNWNDLSHWSTQSGGTPDVCILPGNTNTVVFDENSMSDISNYTVTLNVAGLCDSMLWRGPGKPVFAINSALTISGSLEFSPGMSVPGNNSITFDSERPGETIKNHGIALANSLYFNSLIGSGGWILQHPLKCNNIFFQNGNLNFNGQNVSIGAFYSTNVNNRTLNIANSVIEATLWGYTGSSIPINASNSLIRLFTTSYSGTGFTGNPIDTYDIVELEPGPTGGSISGGNFSKIIMKASYPGTIASNITTDSLIFTLGNTYNIASGSVVTVNKYLANTTGLTTRDCFEKTILKSTDIAPAFIEMGSGATVALNNMNISSVEIDGPANPYTISNSNDLGNNSGWNFGTPPMGRLYWVGGSGNWDDVNHWSDRSGGASVCAIPTAGITVVFDDNSGLEYGTVTINVQAYCDSMLWKMASSTATLNVRYFLSSSSLTIGGSLLLPLGLRLASETHQYALITFTSSRPSETITTNGVAGDINITFNGTGGWKLTDQLTMMNRELRFTAGNLDLSNTTLNIGTFSSYSIGTRTLNIAGATIDAIGWDYYAAGGAPLTAIQSAGSLIRLTTGNFNGKNGDQYNVLETPTGYVSYGNFNKIVVNKGIVTFSTVINTDTLLFVEGSVGVKINSGVSVNVAKYLAKTHSNQLALASSSTTTPATINMGASSTVKMDTLILSQITINGPGPVGGDYPTEGSIDQGGNTHWIFNNPYVYPNAGMTYYWRGGSRDGVFTNTANYELYYPGSDISPSAIFGITNDVVFPPNANNPASMTLTVPGTATFKNLHFNAGSNITLNMGVNNVTGSENLIVYPGNTLSIAASNTATTFKVGKNIVLKENSILTQNNSANLVAEDSIIIDPSATLAIVSGNINTGNFVVKGFVSKTSTSTFTISVTHDFVVFPQAKVNVIDYNITTQNLRLDGMLLDKATSGVTCNIENLQINATGYCDFVDKADYSRITINLGNSMVASGGVFNILNSRQKSYMSVLSCTGDFNNAGRVMLEGCNNYFSGNLINTGDMQIKNGDTYMRATNPYIISLNTPVNTKFIGGSFRFDATTPFTMTEDLIMPTTAFYITSTNRALTSAGYHIKSKFFTIANSSYMMDFSGSLLEAINFTITKSIVGSQNFATTTLSLWDTVNHTFNVHLGGGTIKKVTYTECASQLTIGDGSFSSTYNVKIDSLITGDQSIFLNYPSSTSTINTSITANVWKIDNHCMIYGTNNVAFNVGKMHIPPPATCGRISLLQSLSGVVLFNNISATPIDLRYLYCSNVLFSGSATPYAFVSRSNYDLGGNSGSMDWSGTPDPAIVGQDFYWIGEEGDWHNENNWSFDQFPPKAPAGCVPSMFDNAIFDEYSFANPTQNVNVNTLATINNIRWIDPNKKGGMILNADLEIFGSSNFTGCRYAYSASGTSAKMVYAGSGTITSGGFVSNIKIVHFNATGTYTLTDDLIFSIQYGANCGIFHYAGGLVSNGHNITSYGFNSTSAAAPATKNRTLNLAGSTITLVENNTLPPISGTLWTLHLDNLTSSNFTNSKIIAYSATTNGTSASQSVQYHDVEFYGALQHNRNDYYVGYNVITAMGNSSFRYGFTADSVILTAYKTHTFGYMQTGNPLTANYFITTATPCVCGSDTVRTTIKGGTSDIFRLNVLNTPFDLVRVEASYINSIGAPLNITDGIDNGNNTNVYFTPRAPIPAMDFYWVPNTQVDLANEGSGNWGDPSHWSIGVSGGDPSITNPAGCIPTTRDSVIFDQNSFLDAGQTVTLDINGYCKSMTWTSGVNLMKPTFNFSSISRLYIYGSLELANRLNFRPWSLYMMGSSLDSGVQYIRSNGCTMNTGTYFEGGGRYDIDVSYASSIYIRNGSSLHLHTDLIMSSSGSYIMVEANSSLYSHGNSLEGSRLDIDAGTLPRTIDLSGSTINMNYNHSTQTWKLDNFTTMDISNTNITHGNSDLDYFAYSLTITLAEYCNWNAANSNITLTGSLIINNNTPTSFAFHNVKLTGNTLANAKLGGNDAGALTFNKVEFTGLNTQIAGTGTYTIDSLIYGVSSYNEIQAGKTLNINKYFFASGSPCVDVEIVSTSTTTPYTPAYLNSTNCNLLYLKYGVIRYVEAITSGGCHNYTIKGDPAFQRGATGWDIDEFSASGAIDMLGRDTTLVCKQIPFLQTSEKYGLGESYIWYYKPDFASAWSVIQDSVRSSLLLDKPGYYSLLVIYGPSCAMGGPSVEEKIITFNIVLPPASITTSPATTQLSDVNPVITLIANAVEDPTGTLHNYLWKNKHTGAIVGSSNTYAATDSGTYIVIIQTGENGCIDSASVRILARSPSELLSDHFIPDICSGEEINYEIIAKYSDTKVSWSRAYVAGISPTTGSDSADDNTLLIKETLINSTDQPIEVIYEIIMQRQGSTTTDYVTVTVKPKIPVSATIRIKN